MTEIGYDITLNDVRILNGDFWIIDKSGQQNGALMVSKSCVDILRPQYGIGLTELYPNMKSSTVRNLLDTAKQQIYEDGASSAYINYTQDNKGEYRIDARVKYPE